MDDLTIEYYNQNCEAFITNTRQANMTVTIDKFLKYIKSGNTILDFGCGSGRDTKKFLDRGFRVDATDGSEELCKKATEFTGTEVKKLEFLDLDEIKKYDGIWACASILHLSGKDLIVVLDKIAKALKVDGILYTSFKYGDFEGIRAGRYFTDMTEEKIKTLLTDIKLFSIVEEWVSKDIRPGREEELWLNLIIKKIQE